MSTSAKRAATSRRAAASDRSAAMVLTVTAAASRTARAARARSSAERATSATWTPSPASHFAVASPMPLEPPETSALRPASFRSMRSLPMRLPRSSRGEHGLALFPEGAAPLGVVGAVEAGLHQLLAGGQVVRRRVQQMRDRLLDGTDGQRRVGDDEVAVGTHVGLEIRSLRHAI